MVPPAPSGLDSYRALYIPPAGEQPGMPVDGEPGLHEAPCGGTGRSRRRAIRKFESLGYHFVRAERKPDACGSGEWPWEEIEIPGGRS